MSLLIPALAIAAPTPPKLWTFQDFPTWEAGLRGGIPEVEVKIRLSADELSTAAYASHVHQAAIGGAKKMTWELSDRKGP